MLTNEDVTVNKKYRDSLFRLLFSDNKENALSLYNALNNTSYNNPEELELTTLDDVIYLKQKNDTSFIIGNTLNLYEHQSTFCPNMPLRGFFYFADLLRQRLKVGNRLYSRKLVKIPLPKYVVFYNGVDKRIDDEVVKLHLSDAFEIPDVEKEFEWTTTMLNINSGKNERLKQSCKLLSDYCIFVETLRKNRICYDDIKEAVNMTVNTCIEKGVLHEFLLKHKLEVNNMCLTEFDEEAYLQMLKEDLIDEARIEGIEEGKKRGKIKTEAAYKKLISCLIKEGRLAELENPEKSVEDLFKEYAIEIEE